MPSKREKKLRKGKRDITEDSVTGFDNLLTNIPGSCTRKRVRVKNISSNDIVCHIENPNLFSDGFAHGLNSDDEDEDDETEDIDFTSEFQNDSDVGAGSESYDDPTFTPFCHRADGSPDEFAGDKLYPLGTAAVSTARRRKRRVVKNTYVSESDSEDGNGNGTASSKSSAKQLGLDYESLVSIIDSTDSEHSAITTELIEKYSDKYFKEWNLYLRHGFNILLHGVGSKINIIDCFRERMVASEDFDHIVLNGFFPTIVMKQILSAIVDDILCDLDERPLSHTVQEMLTFIIDHYNDSESGYEDRLFILIHNIDGSCLRSMKNQSMLSKLAAADRIHIVASVDHINAPLIWDQQCLTRYSWLWYDVTSFAPYQKETRYENNLFIKQGGALQYNSLCHVMASLTPNARQIFMLLANYQLAMVTDQSTRNYEGMSFTELYQRSRERFIVNSDLTLRSQLTEFTDHRLVRIKKGLDGVEYLTIPIDTEVLNEYLNQTEDDD